MENVIEDSSNISNDVSVEMPTHISSDQQISKHIRESPELVDDCDTDHLMKCDQLIKQHVRNTIRSIGAHQAESLRSVYFDLGQSSESLPKECEFDVYEAIKAFIYELLPPVFLAPFACMLLEPSFSAGYNVAVNRRIGFPLNFRMMGTWKLFLLDWSFKWFAFASVLLWIYSRDKNVDPIHLALCCSWMLTRFVVIGVKYGFYPKELIEDGRKNTPQFCEENVAMLMIKNWLIPSDRRLRQEFYQAQQVANVDLGAVSFMVDPRHCKHYMEGLRKYHPSDQKFSTTASMELQGELTAEDLCLQIVVSSFCGNIFGNTRAFKWPPMLAALTALFPMFIRVYYFGVHFMGNSAYSLIIYATMLFAMFAGMSSVIYFSVCSAADLYRRVQASRKMLLLLEYPGVPFVNLFPCDLTRTELFSDNEDSESEQGKGGLHSTEKKRPPEYFFIDVDRGGNCYSWVLCRRVLKVVAHSFYLRGQMCLGIGITWAIAASVLCNAIVWLQIEHHVASLATIFIGICTVFFSSITSLMQARNLQETFPAQRLFLRRKRVALSQEIIASAIESQMTQDSSTDPDDRKQRSSRLFEHQKSGDEKRSFEYLSRLRYMFGAVDELIWYEDEEVNPCSIFGVTAGPEMVSAIFGIIIGLIGIAIQKALEDDSTVFRYNKYGWFDASDW